MVWKAVVFRIAFVSAFCTLIYRNTTLYCTSFVIITLFGLVVTNTIVKPYSSILEICEVNYKQPLLV